MTTTAILFAVTGAALAALITWLALRNRTVALQERLALLQQERDALNVDVRRINDLNAQLRHELGQAQANVGAERKVAEQKLALLDDATKKLSDAFAALSADALKSNNQAFLELANTRLETLQQQAKSELDERRTAVETLVKPIQESLSKVDNQLRELEMARLQAYSSLTEQVKLLTGTQEKLESETRSLVTALSQPNTKGNWGGLQLRRVAEIAGMTEHCDFEEQVSVDTDDGRLRPDMIVRLPGGKNIVIDAKAPTKALIESYETSDESVRAERLKDHARLVREHAERLGQKKYWDQFTPAPEFVVMFLPGEAMFSVALHQEPDLIEQTLAKKVILASPTTLIALLRAVAYGWQQEKLAENAQRISDLGRELYDRLRTMSDHFEDVGKGLHRAVDSYNKTVSSMESRVLVSARKLKELGATTKEDIPELQPVESAPRPVQSQDAPSLPARGAAGAKN